jgi:hypothetical protein
MVEKEKESIYLFIFIFCGKKKPSLQKFTQKKKTLCKLGDNQN